MTNKKSISCILCAVAAFCFACNESVEFVDTDNAQQQQQTPQNPGPQTPDPNGCNAANKGKVICAVEDGYAVLKTCDGKSFKTTSGCDPNVCNADNTGCGTTVQPAGRPERKGVVATFDPCTEADKNDTKCFTKDGIDTLATCNGTNYVSTEGDYCWSKCLSDNSGCELPSAGTCDEALEGQTICTMGTFSGKKTSSLSTCKSGKLELDLTSAMTTCKGKICNDDYSACIDNPDGDPFEVVTPEPTNTCTEAGTLKCIEADGKAYIATCDGTEFKYDESNACVSNKCNTDSSNCAYETECAAEDVDETQCFYGIGQGNQIASILLVCKESEGSYSYTIQMPPVICPDGCASDGLSCAATE